MANTIISPNRYVQGRGELKNLPEHAKKLGKKLFVIISASGLKRVRDLLEKSFENTGMELVFEEFQGECCETEIKRLGSRFQENKCDLVVGVGGGKIHDSAKAAAYYQGAPVVIIPTIASTDAPCSALSVIYSETGVFERYLFLNSNPDLVLVDTDIIAAAPSRLLVSGMGDALATYFEARAVAASGALSCAGGKPTKGALALAKLCYETLLEDGVKAKLAVEAGACTQAVENIIEANTYLSGIGFESGGLAGAHAIHNGLTVIKDCHHLYHGEKVAFGTLTQLVLENAGQKLLEEVIGFCMDVGLPTTFAELGMARPDKDQLKNPPTNCTIVQKNVKFVRCFVAWINAIIKQILKIQFCLFGLVIGIVLAVCQPRVFK